MALKVLRRLLREPLTHLAVIGGLMFLVYAAVSEQAPQPTTQILIGPQRIEQLTNAFQAVWQRPPNSSETQGLIDEFVREEIYYREALALGLDQNDTVIRRRLRQKMEFLTDTGADLLEPAVGELETYFAANERSYQKDPRVAFEQIFLGQNPTEEEIAKSLDALRADLAADHSELGERSLLPAQLGLEPATTIDSVFGNNFFQQLETQPTGQWTGPVASGYGMHLVRIVEKASGTTTPLDDVRELVLRNWKAAMALELREQYYARLKERYTVEVIDAVDASNGKP